MYTQKQRWYETEIRKGIDRENALKAAGDDTGYRIEALKTSKIRSEYKAFSNHVGLSEKLNRTGYGSGYKDLKPAGKFQPTQPVVYTGEESENAPRKTIPGENRVNWDYVYSDEYAQKVRSQFDTPEAGESMLTRIKWALSNRDGKNTEELYAIDALTGEEIARITNQNYKSGVVRTKTFSKKLKAAEDTGRSIYCMHNHPGGTPPSVGDFNALLNSKNTKGMIAGHNGSLYVYTAPSKIVQESDFTIAFVKNTMYYSDETSFEKALDYLGKEYGFTWKKL